MKVGYRCVREMIDQLTAFMDEHGFRTLADFKGLSLQYFTSHADLVRRQAESRQHSKAAAGSKTQDAIARDQEWRGDEFVQQSDALARG